MTSHGGSVHADDVGTNGGWVSSSPIDIAGTLTSAASLRADNTLAVDGLFVDDPLVGSSDVHVRGDAAIGGMELHLEIGAPCDCATGAQRHRGRQRPHDRDRRRRPHLDRW